MSPNLQNLIVGVNFMAVLTKPESDQIQSTPAETLSTTFCRNFSELQGLFRSGPIQLLLIPKFTEGVAS